MTMELLKALEKRVEALESQLYGTASPITEITPFDPYSPTYEKKPQLTRAEIVEMAKADVEGRYIGERNGRRMVWGHHGHNTVEFVVNREKRTVVAILSLAYFEGDIRGKGIAKCAPDDVFNVHIGKAIALRRALGLDVPREYLNAPQPTEAQVGDVVATSDYRSTATVRSIKSKLSVVDGRDFIAHERGGEFESVKGRVVWRYLTAYPHIIDDSRDGYVYDVEKWKAARAKAKGGGAA